MGVINIKCVICDSEFVLNGKQGGQNRIICYGCLPTGLNRQERNNRRRELFYYKAQQMKLSLGCSKCGYNKCAAALEWHHPYDNKEHNLSTLLNVSLSLYMQEVQKCELLCANCHREHHFKTTECGAIW